MIGCVMQNAGNKNPEVVDSDSQVVERSVALIFSNSVVCFVYET